MFSIFRLSIVIILIVACNPALASGHRTLTGAVYPFVGYGTIRGTVAHCTYTIVRHGLLLTAKHCFEHRTFAEKPLDPSHLTIQFPGHKFIRSDQILSITLDAGENDFAWLSYRPELTESSVSVPTIRYANALPRPGVELEMPGSPVSSKPGIRIFLTSSACSVTGKQGYFTPKLEDFGYRGLLVELNCPAWFGQSGSAVMEKMSDGTYVLYGVLAHTFDVNSEGGIEKAALGKDKFGPFIHRTIFSPIYLRTFDR